MKGGAFVITFMILGVLVRVKECNPKPILMIKAPISDRLQTLIITDAELGKLTLSPTA